MENFGIRGVLASNLKEIRHKMGLTQEELAEKAGVSTHYIAMIETRKKYPKPEMLEKIAKSLQIEPYKLFSVESNPNEPFERLYRRVITDMKQIVNDAVEKIVNYKNCK